jgi:hypothetical protein
MENINSCHIAEQKLLAQKGIIKKKTSISVKCKPSKKHSAVSKSQNQQQKNKNTKTTTIVNIFVIHIKVIVNFY